jgi:tetratricopeptide (TPR) repeat protein
MMSWFATYFEAGWELLRGDLTACERLAERALELGKEARQPDAIFVYGGQLAPIRHWQGRAAEISGLLEQAASDYPRMAAYRAAVAGVFCWLSRHSEAAAIVREAASDGFEHVTWDSARVAALAFYSDAAAHAGVVEAAETLYGLLEPWQDQVVWTGTTAFGHARMYLGMLAATLDRHEQADEHLAFACEFHDGNGLHLWGARSHLFWAQALAARGESARALEEAARALELAREHGYPPIEERAGAIVKTGTPVGG